MKFQAQKKTAKILADKNATHLINKLKSLVYQYDCNAEI